MYFLFKMVRCLMVTASAALVLGVPIVSAQNVLFSDDFDGPETAVVPEGWTQVPGSQHEPATTDPDFDWKAVSMLKFSILDPNGGDQVRDIMGYFRRDPIAADGSPLLDSPIGTLFALERPPLSGSLQWERMGGDKAPWRNPPYWTGGEQEDGIIPETARVLVADSDEYGGTNMNLAIDSPAVNLNGSAWVRINYDSFLTANQDQSAGNWYRLDDGPWQPLFIEDNYSHGNDQAYGGLHSFALKTDGATTIQVRFWFTGDFSWFWAIDNFEIVGYSNVPPGPAQPTFEFPVGNIDLLDITEFRSSAFSDSDGAEQAFSEWEVRMGNETWGNLAAFSDEVGDFLLDYPALRTSIQPNEFSVNAVNPDDLRGSNDVNARSEDPPHEPILFGREQPGAQFQIDLLAENKSVQPLPQHLFRPGTTYVARVRHWNTDDLAGPWSEEVTFTVNPVASETVLEEHFDFTPPSPDPFDNSFQITDRLSADGWEFGWIDIGLGTLQIHGDDLVNFNDTETDGRGTNGHFSGGVMHAQSDFGGTITTPVIDNSNNGPLTVMFDSSWRTGGGGSLNVIINGQATTILETGFPGILNLEPELNNGSGGVVGDQIIYNNTYVFAVPETANQANVQFQFDAGDSTWWTIDNVVVKRGEPAPPAAIQDWELR